MSTNPPIGRSRGHFQNPNRRLPAACLLLLLFQLPSTIYAVAGDDSFRWQAFLAPFHAVLLHYPIGFVTLAAIFELAHWRRPSPELRRVIGWVVSLSALSTIVVSALGLMRASGGEYEGRSLDLHRIFGITVTVFTLLAWAAHRLVVRPDPVPFARWIFRGLLAIDLLALVAAGHLGGNITHGSEYLTKNAPPLLKQLLDETEPDVAPTEPKTSSTDDEFSSRIQPILSKKCCQCHGPEKQKGRLRLDERESALAGGESGKPAIVAGDPFQSYMVRLLLLPSDHDDVMPPSGKEPLTAEEIVAVIRWIERGAIYSSSIAQAR